MNGNQDLLHSFLHNPHFQQQEHTSNSKEIVIAPPYTLLHIPHSCIKKGAQNVHHRSHGAHTGEISAQMLKECGVEYVIVGHSERRRGLSEGHFKERLQMAIDAGLKVVFCVGESESERMNNLTFDIVKEQLSDVVDYLDKNHDSIVIAYEPVWAIGTGKAATPEEAQTVHKRIRQQLGREDVRIIYGGSVTADNAQSLAKQPDIDGFLVGGASLDPLSFARICSSSF